MKRKAFLPPSDCFSPFPVPVLVNGVADSGDVERDLRGEDARPPSEPVARPEQLEEAGAREERAAEPVAQEDVGVVSEDQG